MASAWLFVSAGAVACMILHTATAAVVTIKGGAAAGRYVCTALVAGNPAVAYWVRGTTRFV